METPHNLGHVYILKNAYMPDLVKIGFTDRDPGTRASELSGFTGVPGKFEIVQSWYVSNASQLEKQIHAELGSFRRTGEFFEMNPAQALNAVRSLLIGWGEIDENGVSYEQKKLMQRWSEKREQEKIRAETRKKQKYLLVSVLSINRALIAIASNAYIVAYKAAQPKGIFSFLKNEDPSIREKCYNNEVSLRTAALLGSLNLPWLFTLPEQMLRITRDVCFALGPKEAKQLTPEDFQERIASWQDYQVKSYEHEKQMDLIKQGVPVPKEQQILFWYVEEPGVMEFDSGKNEKTRFFKIPMGTILSPGKDWFKKDGAIVNRLTNKAVRKYELIQNSKFGFPDLMVIPEDLTLIVGNVPSSIAGE